MNPSAKRMLTKMVENYLDWRKITIYGISLEELTVDELRATINMLQDKQGRDFEQSKKDRDFLLDLMKAKR